MTLVRFNQPKEVQNSVSNLLDDYFGNYFTNKMNSGVTFPAVNVKETPDKFEVSLAAPGLKKEDFKIAVNDNVLTISSENKNEKEENKQEGKFTMKEYGYTKFSRSFTLPENVDVENISAKYEDGELKLEIPKVTQTKLVKEISVQ